MQGEGGSMQGGGVLSGWGPEAFSHRQGCPPPCTRLAPLMLFAGAWTCFSESFSIFFGDRVQG